MRRVACAALLLLAADGRPVAALDVPRFVPRPALAFEPVDEGFLVHGAGVLARITSREVWTTHVSEQLELVGAADVPGEPLDRLPGIVNRFIGDDPRAWRTAAPTFARVRFRDVWPGIDVVWRGERGQLEVDFVVNPGADPAQILLRPNGHVLDEPYTYELGPRGPRPVASRYVAHNDALAIALGAYDSQAQLVIDPVVSLSTYLGGSVSDYGTGIAVDTAGVVYLFGRTASTNFPTRAPLQPTLAGASDVYVAKLDPAGDGFAWSTYLGGTSIEIPYGIAVDIVGNVSVTGYTASNDFPRLAAAQTMLRGGGDAFVTKLNPIGTALLFSTFWGGNDTEEGHAVAVDGAGSTYVGGVTYANNFPVVGMAAQPGFGGLTDGFVLKLNGAGTAVFSTYLGSAGDDEVTGIAVDAAGSVYVAGTTTSPGFPVTAGALQMVHGGLEDAFVTRLNATGSAIVASTFFGGPNNDSAGALAIDATGSVYVTGFIASTLPMVNAAQPMYAGGGDAYVLKLDAMVQTVVFSTYLGGTGAEYGTGIAITPAGDVVVAGHTGSATTLPVVSPSQAYGGGARDAFVARVGRSGGPFQYVTWLGGNGDDQATAVAVDSAGNAWVTGSTTSTTFPTMRPLQAAPDGGLEGFFALLTDGGGLVGLDAGSDGGSGADGGFDGGPPSADAGMDGGTTADGGSAEPDGGATSSDGGATSSDGGATSSDGGATSTDGGGATTSDGGLLADGGFIPGPDAGSDDGGTGEQPNAKHYDVGCACGSGGELPALLALLAAALGRRRRRGTW